MYSLLNFSLCTKLRLGPPQDSPSAPSQPAHSVIMTLSPAGSGPGCSHFQLSSRHLCTCHLFNPENRRQAEDWEAHAMPARCLSALRRPVLRTCWGSTEEEVVSHPWKRESKKALPKKLEGKQRGWNRSLGKKILREGEEAAQLMSQSCTLWSLLGLVSQGLPHKTAQTRYLRPQKHILKEV